MTFANFKVWNPIFLKRACQIADFLIFVKTFQREKCNLQFTIPSKMKFFKTKKFGPKTRQSLSFLFKLTDPNQKIVKKLNKKKVKKITCIFACFWRSRKKQPKVAHLEYLTRQNDNRQSAYKLTGKSNLNRQIGWTFESRVGLMSCFNSTKLEHNQKNVDLKFVNVKIYILKNEFNTKMLVFQISGTWNDWPGPYFVNQTTKTWVFTQIFFFA